MAEILAVVNQKGGVGKTTTSVNLGSYLANPGHPTLIIDLDPQANATSGVGVKVAEGTPTLYEVLIGQSAIENAIQATSLQNLNIIASTPDLAGGAMELMDQPYREFRLRRELKEIAGHYRFILIDCPPSLGLLTVNGLSAAHKLLIPVQCEYFALEGLNQLLETVKLVRAHLNPNLQVLGAVLTMYDRRTALNRKIVREVRKTFPGHVFESIIPRNTDLRDAHFQKQDIFSFNPRAKAALAYDKLIREVFLPEPGTLEATGQPYEKAPER
jgi:chromosome partitioning protein